MKNLDIIGLYNKAREFLIQHGYEFEIDLVDKRTFEDIDVKQFLSEYIYVVLNSGMKNQVADKIFRRYCRRGLPAIGHDGKRNAIAEAEKKCIEWFKELSKQQSDRSKLEYLSALPFIGKITKYHLARNLGLDVAKPDRHLVKMADRFQFNDVHEMCKKISEETGDRIGTVDVILWRYCNLLPAYDQLDDKTMTLEQFA